MNSIMSTVVTELRNDYKENAGKENVIYKTIYILGGIIMRIIIVPAVLIYRGIKALVNLI